MIGCLFLLLFTKDLIIINILLVIFGFFASSFTILFTLYVEIVQNDPKKIARYNASLAIGWFLGVLSGGMFNAIYGIEHMFMYSFLSLLLAFFFVIFIKEDRNLILEQNRNPKETNQLPDNLNTDEEIRANLKSIFYSLFFRSFGIRPILGIIVTIIGLSLTNETEIGFLIGVNPLLQFFLMILVGKLITNKNLKVFIILGNFLTVFVIFGYIYSFNFGTFLIFQILVALSYSLLWMGSLTYIAQNSTPKNKGKYIGYATMSSFAGDSIGGLFYSLMLAIFYSDYFMVMYFMIIFPVISSLIISFKFNPINKVKQLSKMNLDSEGEH
jgi:MFS family permease